MRASYRARHASYGGVAAYCENWLMPFNKYLIPLASVVFAGVAYGHYGWPGIALVVGGLVMWMLLHFTRMLQVLKRAANRPVGHVDSAVMLNAKLHQGLALLHVVALTRSLGLLESPKDAQPEHFRWTDASQSTVLCVFQDGKLQRWELARPQMDVAPPAALAP